MMPKLFYRWSMARHVLNQLHNIWEWMWSKFCLVPYHTVYFTSFAQLTLFPDLKRKYDFRVIQIQLNVRKFRTDERKWVFRPCRPWNLLYKMQCQQCFKSTADKSIMITNHYIWELQSDSEIMHFSLLVKKRSKDT